MPIVPLTKGDLVTEAARKAAIASSATLTDIEPQTLSDGLVDLELMLMEWYGPDGKVIDTGYTFADPATGEILPEQPHNLYPYAINGVMLNLAVRMMPDMVTEAGVTLRGNAAYSKQVIVNFDKQRRIKSRYRSRTPTGSGNRFANLMGFRYYPGQKKDDSEE